MYQNNRAQFQGVVGFLLYFFMPKGRCDGLQLECMMMSVEGSGPSA